MTYCGMEYAQVVEKYMDRVYRAALSACKNPSDAQDVVQNTFLKLLYVKRAFRDEEHLRRWLLRVAVNECNSLFRLSFRKRSVPLEEAGEIAAEPFDEEQAALYEAVLKLPAKYRTPIHLYYYEGYSAKEIAEILHIRENVVSIRLFRAREKLREMLEA